MSNAMLSGVSGLKAHQQMIDVAGNNLANVNTTSFKSSSVTFQELLSQTLQEASAPTTNLGGTNPMQIGSGVITGAVNRDMGQGSLVYTGNSLDMAIEGSGYFTLNDGQGDKYTRVGQFAVDSQYFLVDPTNGYRVQRLGNEGVSEGFQDATSNDIRIPYDIALPANATDSIKFSGNLSGNKTDPTRNLLTSDLEYTIQSSGAVASRLTELQDLTQTSGTLSGSLDTLVNIDAADKIEITGTRKDGTAFTSYYYYNDGSAASAERIVLDTGNSLTALVGTSNLLTNNGAGATTLDITFGGDTISIPIGAGATLTASNFVTEWNTAANHGDGTADSTAGIVDGQIIIVNDTTGAQGNTFSVAANTDVVWANTTDNVADTDAHYADGSPAGSGDTVGDLLDFITSCFDEDGEGKVTATMVNGEIRVEDDEAGYSQTYLSDMTFSDDDSSGGSLDVPSEFNILVAGGQIEKTINVDVFDAQGNSYTLAGSFVRRDDQTNQWDFVVKSIGGQSVITDRFVRQIGFQVDGSYGDMQGSDTNTIEIAFPSDPTNIRTITLDFGTLGELNGLTQFGGSSTASVSGQDGYAAGWLSTLSVSSEGTLVGVFSNGIRRDIAALKIATFQNAAGLKSIGGNYFEPTANSGDAVPNKATEGGAGSVQGGSIEESNVDVAEEFVKLIEAQNGYQANARTIKVANEMLNELTNLIR